jgi:hypothetical protein
LHKALRFNSKISLVIFSIMIVGLVLGLNHLQISAQTPDVYHKEIEIIPDPHKPNLYTFIGSACVDSKGEIIDPKVMLYSDLEQKPLWLTHVFHSNECFGAVEKIRANDPDSIKAKIVAYGNYTVIEEMEEKIVELKNLQAQLQRELQEIRSDKFPEHHQKYIDAMREKSDALFKTQKLLQKETAKYYEVMRYLHPSE